jgi:glycosyltransferase involved in cell wall biosynthesis
MRSLAVLLASPGWGKIRPDVALVNPSADARLLEKIGVRYRRLNAPVFEKGRAGAAAYFKMMWHLVKCFVFGWRFAAELRAGRVALVHLNNELFAGLPALFGAFIAGVPATCHLRSQRAPSFIERAASLFCRRFVCISETGARFFRRRLPSGSGARVCAINDPFAEADGVAVEERRETKNAPVVGMISNFVPGKGHEFFVEAIPLIAKRFPDARFLIAGAEVGEGGRSAGLRAMAEANGACARLEFLPWQSDVAALLRRLDVLVDCSTLAEGYRRTIVEAMLAGAAVVATDVGPAREIIFDRQTGMLVRAGDGRAIAEAVSALLGDAGLRGKISGRGRALARRIFSRERTVGAMQKFLFESGRN